jgi:hypothetical protein
MHLLALLPLLAACAKEPLMALPTDSVRDEASAVALAQVTCAGLTGPTKPGEWKVGLSAGPSGRTWYVYLDYVYEVRIDAASGMPTDCEQMIIIG